MNEHNSIDRMTSIHSYACVGFLSVVTSTPALGTALLVHAKLGKNIGAGWSSTGGLGRGPEAAGAIDGTWCEDRQ